jgi:hypothetical protein
MTIGPRQIIASAGSTSMPIDRHRTPWASTGRIFFWPGATIGRWNAFIMIGMLGP